MSSFDHLLNTLNRNFQFGFHHFEANQSISESLSRFYDHEIALYSRRFRADEKNGVTTFTLDLPGFKPGDLDVKLERGILTVKAKNDKDEFEQSLNVGRDIDPDKVSATLEHGILIIKLERHASAKPRDIPVK